jgi:TRAP-type C4-dicarboxylate transport system substrate-binding protein
MHPQKLKYTGIGVLILIVLCVEGICFAAGEAVTLRYSCFFPPTHIQSQLAEEWCREVEKRTQGRVHIEYYAGQTLTKAKQCYDGTVEGVSDIGFSVLAYSRGRFPVMAAVDLPLGYRSGQAATQVVNKVYEKFKPKELRDTEVMYLHAHGPGLLHTKSKPVKTLEDLKGLKLRGTGTSSLVIKALGGTPVPKPMPETYQMLQKGVVDGSFYPMESNKGWKLGEVAHHATASFDVAYTTSFFVVMNKARWQELPPDVQQIIRSINQEWAVKHGQAWDDSDLQGKAFFLEKGGQMTELESQEAERWKQAVAPIIETYIEKAKAKNIDGKAVVEFTMQTLKQVQ